MFQSFEDQSEKDAGKQRIDALRTVLEQHNLTGYIVPRTDEFQNEYLPPYAERLAWLTGFTGSAGLALVLMDKALVFTDGRYAIQVREQTDPEVITPIDIADTSPAKWLAENLSEHDRIGFDPWLLTPSEVERYQTAADKVGARLVSEPENLIDPIWTDQPARSEKSISAHPLQFAGKSTADKLADIRKTLEEKKADAVVITLCDSVSWLFNIRGRDIIHNPLVLANAIVPRSGKAELFIDANRVPEDAATTLAATTRLRPPGDFTSALESLSNSARKILIDKSTSPDAVRQYLCENGATIIDAADPCILPKAIKNPTELEGARAAHIRDGAVMARFLYWLDTHAGSGDLDEITVARKLEALRAETGMLKEISFDTISASGPNAALPHYRVTTASNRKLSPGEIYLCDSGAQYQDGTTDITRTIMIGEPTPDMIRANTLVLKGMIALSRARFPKGTNGAQLDTLARQHLWQSGLDFDHGTGHGVGSYLCVHEGPARISKAGTVPLKAGMILSNEPGYYREGSFGIRIENLVAVTPAETPENGERPMHGFETLTLAPIDLNLIDPALMSETEIAWLNAYHETVRGTLTPLVDEETGTWLQTATKKI